MYTQQQSKFNEKHTGSPDLEVLDELEPQVSLNPNVMPEQLQTIETGQREANSSTPSEHLRSQQTQSLSREQSFVRVAAENQQAKIEPFDAWMVKVGQWGGRTLTPDDCCKA